jgi:hypothetical protein
LDAGDIQGYRALQNQRANEPAQSVAGEALEPSRPFYLDMQRSGRSFEDGLAAAEYGSDSFYEKVGATAQQRDDVLALAEDVADLARAGDEDAQHLLEKAMLVFSQRALQSIQHFKSELGRKLTLAESALFDELISG